MSSSREEVVHAAAALGYTIPESDVADYVGVLSKAKASFEEVEAMEAHNDGTNRLPTNPDIDSSPRDNIHLPEMADNPLGGWAYPRTCPYSHPASDLLKGKTVCLKDNIAMAGVPCLLGTSTFTDWIPKTNATVITRILLHGGTITGKAVCENLSRGAVSCTAASGPVDNPYAKGYSAKGSSSGTAALVGTALCGLYGMKATTGLVPYTGIASNDASMDYVGPMTSNCRDCATLLETIAGVDGLDDRQIAGTPWPDDVPKYAEILRLMELKNWLKGVSIGILKEGLEPSTMDVGVKEKFLAAAKVVPIHTQARTLYAVMSKMGNHMGMLGMATGRRSVLLTDLFEKKSLPYTQEVMEKMNVTSKDGLLVGELGWTQYPQIYAKSVNIMRKVKDSYDKALEEVDFLVMPTTFTPSNPYPASRSTPLQHSEASARKLENTSPFTGSGHSALALPIGFVPAKDDPNIRLPASLQIVGRYWDEVGILKAAYAWENTQDWKTP
ncbi:putative amidase [Clohesyomyces aquaticus]|uniref:Putative amidase n=1 Tax=Clohesyomyces aquaticus TaxID=1231657 RepID=A0A1Y1XYX0_9PLEO|nr:putative amidase [Clohesyomyces aquaticus]